MKIECMAMFYWRMSVASFSFSLWLSLCFGIADVALLQCFLLKSPSGVYALLSQWSYFCHVSLFDSFMHHHVSLSDSFMHDHVLRSGNFIIFFLGRNVLVKVCDVTILNLWVPLYFLNC